MPRFSVLPALLLAWAAARAGLPRTEGRLPPPDALEKNKPDALEKEQAVEKKPRTSVTVTRRRRPDDPAGLTATQIVEKARRAIPKRQAPSAAPGRRRLQDMLDLEDTFVENAEKTREVTSVSPSYGSAHGGTRLHIDGTGFATEFFSGSNKVIIGQDSHARNGADCNVVSCTKCSDGTTPCSIDADCVGTMVSPQKCDWWNGWVACDVVEGACTVDCGGDQRIVCDTRAWFEDRDEWWLDVHVQVDDTVGTYDLIKTDCFHYLSSGYEGVPRFTHIYPRHAAAGSGIALKGSHLGKYVSEYRTIYIGSGRPPQGGNVQVGSGVIEARPTHALCRADDLNFAVNDQTGQVDSFSLPVLVEDAVLGHNSPITTDAVNCYLGDFPAGSYNASAHMASTAGLSSGRFGGLTFERFAHLSRDAHGVTYAFQYYPHVTSVMPAVGSLEGGTLLTIRGGGFSDDEAQVFVSVGGRDCKVVRSTLVEVVCRTSDLSDVNEGPPQDYVHELGSLEPLTDATPAPTQQGDDGWTIEASAALQSEGLWAAVNDYVEAPGCAVPPCTPSWLVLAPSEVPLDGLYEVTLVVPAVTSGAGAACSLGAPLATQASVLVADASNGYVPLNVSLLDTSINLGRFSFARGPSDGRRGAVIVDTVGADGCVVVRSVSVKRVGPMAGGRCGDPLAANYVPNSTDTCDCVYVGGRGLRQRAWSLMAPAYRDGVWLKDLDTHDAYATGRACLAPANASSTNFTTFHGRCNNPNIPINPIVPETGFPLPTEPIVATTLAPTTSGLPGLPGLDLGGGGTSAPLAPVVDVTGITSITDLPPLTPVLEVLPGAPIADGPITSPLVAASVASTLTGELIVEPLAVLSPITGVLETQPIAPIVIGVDTIEVAPLEPMAPLTSLVAAPLSSPLSAPIAGRRRLFGEDPAEDDVCRPHSVPKTGRLASTDVAEPAADAFCCLSQDWWGCDATWNLADEDGFVDVLRQDTQMCAPFSPDELRRDCYKCLGFATDAHQPMCHCCSRLDELEFMRTLSDGRIELKLEWPGTMLDYMHWRQRMNPAQFTLNTRIEQYDEALDYEAVHTPYFESDEWGGLEYGGTSSLLDGSFNSENWWYAVGSFSDTIPATNGDEFVSDTFVRKATLKAKPDYTYFQPKCISCEACYDSDGYWRDDTVVETWQNASACVMGQPCSIDAITQTVVPGCPALCKGRRIRAFEASAAHHTYIVRDRYATNVTSVGNCSASNSTCGPVDVINTNDIGAVPAYRPGAGSFEGFFVAPRTASYVFVGAWDAALELSLSVTSDPRHLQVLMGGALQIPPADGDVVGGWTRFGRSWYRASSEERTWADAQQACSNVGAHLAEVNSAEEQDFLYGLCNEAGAWQCWLGGSALGMAGMWRWSSTRELFAAGSTSTTVASNSFTRWGGGEPSGNDNGRGCLAMWGNGWDDNGCASTVNYLCESSLQRARSAPITLAKDEARYFELLHVHNSSERGGYLGLELEIDGLSTRVGGTHSLSMEFFRVQTQTPLPVVVRVGPTSSETLASASQGRFAYAKEATPTITDVFPRSGGGGQLISITGTLFSTVIGELEVGIGGAACDVVYVNHTVIECVLRRGEASAGAYHIDVRVVGAGFARHVNATRSTYTIPLVIHDFAPRNGSLMGGDVMRIWGEGFARLGPQNKVTVAGLVCTPRTLKNFHCRVSQFDSGYECAATSSKGYEMVWHAYASSRDRANAEWLDYSSTTYIECVLDDLMVSTNTSGPVTVQLLREGELHDAHIIHQNYTRHRALELAQATRNMDCFVLMGYRIWNWGLELENEAVKDCVLYDEAYEARGTFMQGANFSGAKAVSAQIYALIEEKTPVITGMDAMGMAGQELTIKGRHFDANIPEWDFHWRMDEFGFYTQPASPVVYIGGSPTVLTFANSTVVKVLPTYNLHDRAWPVTMHVRGRGLAAGNKSFVYVNYLYSVEPQQGSIQGGTRLTLTGSGFTTDHTFYSDESVDMGTSLSGYTIRLPGSSPEIECGLHMTTCEQAQDCALSPSTCGSLCDVVSASKFEIVCDTRPANDGTPDTPVVVDMHVEWNYEPFYFSCASSTCTPPGCVLGDADAGACAFAYSAAATPRLSWDPPSYVAPGDALTLAMTDDAFDWFAIGEGQGGPMDLALTITVSIGAAACTSIEIDEAYTSLTCLLDINAAPETGALLGLFIDGYGNAEVSGTQTIDIKPRVTSFAPTRGSLAGGTLLEVRGAGFREGTLVYVGGVATCSDVTITNASFLTCVTEAVPTVAKDAVVDGVVTAYVVDIQQTYAPSEGAGVYGFQGNDTRYTPRVHNSSSRGGAVFLVRERPLIFRGAGFGQTGKTVTIGSWNCPLKWETASEIACDPPKLPAGMHVVKVHVPTKGFAVGYHLWYRSPFVLDTQTLSGSVYGGQSLLLAGAGFPDCVEHGQRSHDTCADAAKHPCAWDAHAGALNFMYSGSFFRADVVASSYNELRAIVTLRTLESAASLPDAGALTVEVGISGEIGFELLNVDAAYEGEAAQAAAHDGSLETFWDVKFPTTHAPLAVDVGCASQAIDTTECPAEPSLANCDTVAVGELCEGDGECGTTNSEDNCGDYDVYRRLPDSNKAVRTYTVTSQASNCLQWTFAGSEDGAAWDDLDSYVNNITVDAEVYDASNDTFANTTVCASETRTETRRIAKPGLYRYYRWLFDGGAITTVVPTQFDGSFLRVMDVTIATEAFAGEVAHERTSASTPEVTAIIQEAPGRFRSTVEIAGANLGGAAGVTVGGLNCPIITTSDTAITCASPNASAGQHAVVVTTSKGVAGPSHLLEYEVGLYADNRTLSTPERGSLAGGTYVTLIGDGFAETLEDNKVTIAGADCAVVEFFEDFHESLQPTAYPSVPPTPAPTLVPSYSTLPTPAPSFHPTTVPSSLPSQLPSAVPTATPSRPPSAVPTPMPSALPSSRPSSVPPSAPKPAPTAAPTYTSGAPTASPTTPSPSIVPFAVPTSAPTYKTDAPSASPTTRGPTTVAPSHAPTIVTTGAPSGEPSNKPTAAPTSVPSSTPTSVPLSQPSGVPSVPPTFTTPLPTDTPLPTHPTALPTTEPSSLPSSHPTSPPSSSPTARPSSPPSASPTTPAPTIRPTPVPAPAPTPAPVLLASPTAAPTKKPTPAPTTARPTIAGASRRPSYGPTALPTPSPSAVPSLGPTAAPTTLAPTPAATNFSGFHYRSTLTCVTGPMPANVSYAADISARPRVRTRLRTGTTLIVRAGTTQSGDSGFVATQSEAGCRFRDPLWSTSTYSIFFGFYDAKTRSLEASYEPGYEMTVAESQAAAAFIATYEERDDLIFVVVTNEYFKLHWEPLLPAALKRCGATSALHKLPASDGAWVYGHYLLVGQCGRGVAWSAQHGLEMSNADTGTALQLEVDVDATFELWNGDSHAGFNFTYAPALTPTLVSVSRLNGTTAGGTTLRLNVTGIARGLASVDNTSVTLGGIACALRVEDVRSYRDQFLCDWDGVDCDTLGIAFHNETNTTMITCLTNAWDYSGDARDAEILVSLWPWGHARNPHSLTWAYVDLWSSLTTWGGLLENKPLEGDSVLITRGQYIVLDESPPALHLLMVYGGVLEFAQEVGDLALNASYIFVFGGKMVVGTEEEPFPHRAVITLTGDRDSYELPVYGAKCLAVRDAILDLHGLPQRPWTRLSQSVQALNDTIYLVDPVDWKIGDRIFITSTSFDPMETEERIITSVAEGGSSLTLDQRLFFFHEGDGYWDETGREVVPEYRAEVGLLSRNVIVQGDDQSKQQQFGGQIVFASSQLYDDSIIGRLSNIETRNVGQGLKLGKYPIHFHMVGNVSKSYVKNCTVHHANNRAIAIHGVNHLTVSWNVVFDTRGHAIFIEDGTEIRNIISYNLVALVRPIWSLLLVDQSPACFWIVNPDNDVYNNVAAASSHYGFWYRQLTEPDGISGQSASETNSKQFPIYTPLAIMSGNVAHSTKRHGLKVSDYFPTINGANEATFSSPATFRDFVGYNNGRFGVWGEFLIDVSFDGLRILNPGIAGLEFLYMNGRGSEFAKSTISNSYMVGRTREIATAGSGDMCEGLQDVNGAVNHDGNGCIHALHLPGIGSELLVKNATFVNFEAPMWTCSWCVGIKGGYEVDFANITYVNVSRPATFKKGFGGDIATAGILNDLDGSLGSGAAGGVVAPYAGHFANNPDCVVGYDTFDQDLGLPEYVTCTSTIRRVSFAAEWTSAKTNTMRLYKFPHIRIVDVTDWSPSQNYRSFWELPFWHVQSGDQSCVEQAPQGVYLFLLATGREYAMIFRDQLGIPVTAKGKIYAAKMKPSEKIIIHLNQKAPFQAAMRYGEVTQKASSRWGENENQIGWEDAPPAVPSYSIGSVDAQACASNEFERCGDDDLHRMPQVTSLDVHTRALEQVAGAREVRGEWLRPVASPLMGDWVVCDSSGTYLEGSQIAFCELSANNYEELRWRHGFDGDVEKLRFFTAREGWGTAWRPGAPNGTMTVSSTIAPMYCWDIEHDGRGTRLDDVMASKIELRWCEEKDETGYQDWEWVSTATGGMLRNAITQTCAGTVTSSSADGALRQPLILVDCASEATATSYGALVFEQSWLGVTALDTVRHGLFHFDRDAGPSDYDPNGVTWTNETNGAWDWWYPVGLIPYDVTNISTMSFLMAGNSTLEIETSLCGPEGCPTSLPVCRSCGTRHFKWWTGDAAQDAANWNVTDDPSVDVPSEYWEGTIWDDWTVIIGKDTPVVNRLVVRGTLLFEHDAGIDITLHAHYISVEGGSVIMGNASHPIDNRTTATIALHGDKYLTTKKKNNEWQRVYNFKRIDLNGNLTMHGRPTVATWRKVGLNAFVGQDYIHLNEAVDWEPGDEVLFSSSKHHGAGDGSSRAKAYATHIITEVSLDGKILYLDTALTQDYVGEVVDVEGLEVDVRAVVALRRWNVRILGADTTLYDRVSGLSAYEQGWGANIRALDAQVVAKPGWHSYMPLYDLMGTEQLPNGHITVKHGARFERCGKGYFNGAPEETWDGVACPPCIVYAEEQDHAEFVGAHAVDPYVGGAKGSYVHFLQAVDGPVAASLTFRWNVFVGENFAFGGDHAVSDNVFLGGNEGCPIGLCPQLYMVRLIGATGALTFNRNYVQGAMWAAVLIDRPCVNFAAFEDNVAVSSWIGFRIEGVGCSSLNLRAHRNSVGIAADTQVISNVLLAENGIGLMPVATPWQAGAQKTTGGMKEFDPHSALQEVKESVFVGVLLDLQRKGSGDCVDWTGVKMSFEDWNVYFRDWDYLGIARGGFGGSRGERLVYGVALPDAKLDVHDAVFVAYSSPRDTCIVAWTKNQVPVGYKRQGVAFGTEAAALGHGSGTACLSLGNAQCYPVHTYNLGWRDTPFDGRIAFSPGTGGMSGLEHDQDFGACTHYDADGSVYNTSTTLYKANVPRTWPEDILESCQEYAANYDDNPDFSKCPWFIRANDYLLDAANDASRRGYASHSQALGLDEGKCSWTGTNELTPRMRPCATNADCWKRKWGCHLDGATCECQQDPCQPAFNVSDNRRVQSCSRDFVTLKFTNPLKITSGSEVLFAPAAISTVRRETMCSESYFQDDTVVAVLPSYPVDSEAAQFLERWPSPYVMSVPNQGIYHIDYTGDVTAFSAEGDYGFQLLGTSSRAPVEGGDFAVIVTVKFLQPCKLLFYVNGRKVNGAVRRLDVTTLQENGFGFQHATTKIAAVVLKGSEEVKMQALQVVQVSLAIAVDFDAFFADNLIDPAAIDEEFADLIPPNYAADYDPSGGNIVLQDPFVRNMASVLMIDPSRIKVTNIVPGNRRRRLEGRRLLEDGGLEIQWELQEVDLCNGDEECNYGMCAPSTGLCTCTGNYGGAFCNITGGRRLQDTNATNATASGYDELLKATATLEEKAETGSLDPGYEVTGMLVTKPLDICGVEGGNGTSCLDDCGVANGDSTSCVDTPAPTMAPPTAFTECGEATLSVGRAEKQQVRLTATSSDGFQGTFTLSFAGSATAPLAVFASAGDIEQAFKDLDSVRDEGVVVSGLLVNATTATFSETIALSATEVKFGIEFPSQILTTEQVQNVGDIPLVTVDTSLLTGAFDSVTVEETCAGAYKTGYAYAEQAVTLSSATALASLDGSFRLVLQGNTSRNGTSLALPATATAAQVAAALTAGIGEGLFKGAVPEGRVEVWTTARDTTSVTFTVRFYTLSGEALTGCSGTGAFDALIPVVDFTQTASVSVSVIQGGRVPASAMPVDVAEVAATAAAAVTVEAKVMVAVKPLVVVCGDGVYLTAEDCDDGNRIGGDGCSANCTVESGYVCTKPVSRTSVCSLPLKAMIQFQDTASRVVAEGNRTSIIIERIGDNATTCQVTYSTLDSTARHLPRENSNYMAGGLAAAAGDYAWANGTLEFGAGDTAKSVTLEALDDETFDGDVNEVFLLRLSATTCAGGFVGDASALDVYIYIEDSDVAPSAMPTPLPSAQPTTSLPSSVPTLYPSLVCPTGEYLFRLWAEASGTWTVHAVDGTLLHEGLLAGDFRAWVCLNDGCYDVSVTDIDAEKHWRLDDVRGASAVSKGPQTLRACSTLGALGGFPTFAPTLSSQPTFVPTAAPSRVPSASPSYLPTALPTSSIPTPTPTTVKPTLPVPTFTPTAFPSWDNCNEGTGLIDRSTLYRYDASIGGVDYKVQEALGDGDGAVYIRGETIYVGQELRAKGHFCLADGCYFLDLMGATIVDLRSAIEGGPRITGPASNQFFCVTQGVFDRYPSAAPTLTPQPSSRPTPRPSLVPVPQPTASPSRMPVPAPTTNIPPTLAPTSTDLAVKISATVAMASSDSAAAVWASDDKKQVLREGLAAGSQYTRADMVELTAVTAVASRRRRLLASYDLSVAFDILVVAEAYGFDESEIAALYDLVATNLTQHINSGSFNDAVVEAAADLGVVITVSADPQVVDVSFVTVQITTPAWYTGAPSADPTAQPSVSPYPTRSPTKAPDLYYGMGFWLFLVLCAVTGAVGSFLIVYTLGNAFAYMRWHHPNLFHPNKKARVMDASQLTTEELEATLRARGLQEAADAFAQATRRRDEPAGPLPPRMMAHARTWADRHRRGRMPPIHPVSDDHARTAPARDAADLANLSEEEVAGLLRQTAEGRGLRRLRAASHAVSATRLPPIQRDLVSGGRPARNRPRAQQNLAKLRGAARATAAFRAGLGETSEDELGQSAGAQMYRASVAEAEDLGRLSISQLKRVARERHVDVSGCLDKADFVSALEPPEPRTRSPSRERSPSRGRSPSRSRRVVRRGQPRDDSSPVYASVQRTLRDAGA